MVKCGHCREEHATVENVRSCALEAHVKLMILRNREPKAPVVDLDAYRKHRDSRRRELLSRRDVNLAGIERARATLRAVRAHDPGADHPAGSAGRR